jgi:hypothetical protein
LDDVCLARFLEGVFGVRGVSGALCFFYAVCPFGISIRPSFLLFYPSSGLMVCFMRIVLPCEFLWSSNGVEMFFCVGDRGTCWS